MSEIPIPNDWVEDDGYCLYLICVPNSRDWAATFRGRIYELTRGRLYDRSTGIIVDAQSTGKDIYNSIMTCDMTELTDALNKISAALYTDFDGPNETPIASYLQHLQALGQIPGAGDSIQDSLINISKSIGSGLTVDEVEVEVQAFITNNPGLASTIKDLLETITFLKDIFPGLGSSPFGAAMGILKSFSTWRFRQNQLGIQATQAQWLRYIGNALSAVQQDAAGTPTGEDTIVSEAFKELVEAPWLTQAVVTVLDPSPAGELAVITRVALTAQTFWGKFKDTYNSWFGGFFGGGLGQELPQSSVTGQLAKIEEALDDIEGLGDMSVNIEGIASQITALLPIIPAITSLCSCGAGGGAGCSCGAGAGAPATGGGTFDPPQAPGQPPGGGGPGGGGTPPEYPSGGTPYSEYKCGAAAFVFDTIYNGLVYVAGLSAAAAGISAGVAFSNWLLASMVAGGTAFTTGAGVVVFAFVPGWVLAATVAAIAVVVVLAGSGVIAVFKDLADEVILDREQALCDLYDAQDVDAAKAVMSDVLTTAITNFVIQPPYDGFDAAIRSMFNSIIEYLMPNALFNSLFELNNDADGYDPLANCNCGNCIISWDFTQSLQNVQWDDVSTGTATADGFYDSPNESASSTMFLPDVSNISSIINWDVVDIPANVTITDGDVFGITMGSTSDGEATQCTMVINYTDATFQVFAFVWQTETIQEIILSGTGKEIDSLRVQVARSTGQGGAGSTHIARVKHIQLTLANPASCPAGYPAL